MQLEWVTRPAKRLVDALLLRERERVAAARSELQQENAARCHAAALRRIRGAREVEYTDPVASLALYREAASLLIVAIVQGVRPERVELARTPADAWRELDATGARPPGAAPDGLDRAREVLASDDPLVADGIASDALPALVRAAAETVAWLEGSVESRTAREVRATRAVRVGSALASSALVVTLALYSALTPKDLALNMPVTASSQRPGSPAPGGVDNGEIEQSYGVHTNVEVNPWVRIDLGASVTIREVKVYNRGDGYESEMLPLLLQLSDDDDTYRDVAERTEVFTRDRPWVAKIEGQQARYVRVYMPRQGYIALTEIEVH